MDGHLSEPQVSKGSWKPHLLKVSGQSLISPTDGENEVKQHWNLPFFQEWLAYRRFFQSAEFNAYDFHEQGHYPSCRAPNDGLTWSPDPHSSTAGKCVASSPEEHKPILCKALPRSNAGGLGSVVAMAGCSFNEASCNNDRMYQIQSPCPRNEYAHDFNAENQQKVNSFCLESSKRIRNVILRRFKREKDIVFEKPDSIQRFSTGESWETARDKSASITPARYMDFRSVSPSPSLSSVAISALKLPCHSCVNDEDRFVEWDMGKASIQTGETVSLKSVSDAATQSTKPEEHLKIETGVHLIYASRAEYKGEVRNVLPHGVGWYFRGLCTYRGEWRHGRPHGRGDYVWPDGDRYCGEFVDGMRAGHGIYYTWTGEKYAGTWVNDELSGLGMLTQGDGSRLVLSPCKIHRALTPHGSIWSGQCNDAVVSCLPLHSDASFPF